MMSTLTLKATNIYNDHQGEILIARNASLSQLQAAINRSFRISNFVVMHKNEFILLNDDKTLDQFSIDDNEELYLFPVGRNITEEEKPPEKISIFIRSDDCYMSTILADIDWTFRKLWDIVKSTFGYRKKILL